MKIDAHQHFWKLARGDYGWLTSEAGMIYRDFLPEDLLPHLARSSMDYTVAIQAAPTVAETEFLLELYEQHDFIAGVVGWLDLEATDFKDRFQGLRKYEGVVGLRPMIQDILDDQWVLRPQVLENIGVLVDEDFPLDLLILPRHLPHIIKLLQQFPNLRAVVNHAAKPDIKGHVFEPWKDLMKEIASFAGVMCKLSGLVTEADHKHWTADHLKPYVQYILGIFDTDSVMFGSDWPVCLQAGNYREIHQVLYKILQEKCTTEELQAIFGKNAALFYKLPVV